MARIVRTIHIGLYQPEAEVVNKIEASGYELTEIIREVIREYGKENFPEEAGYVQIQKEKYNMTKAKIQEREEIKIMSSEEYVEKLRGKIVDGKVKFIASLYQRGEGGTCGLINIPLTEIKNYNTENNAYIREHGEILDRTYKFNGNEISKEDFDTVLGLWEAVK